MSWKERKREKKQILGEAENFTGAGEDPGVDMGVIHVHDEPAKDDEELKLDAEAYLDKHPLIRKHARDKNKVLMALNTNQGRVIFVGAAGTAIALGGVILSKELKKRRRAR